MSIDTPTPSPEDLGVTVDRDPDLRRHLRMDTVSGWLGTEGMTALAEYQDIDVDTTVNEGVEVGLEFANPATGGRTVLDDECYEWMLLPENVSTVRLAAELTRNLGDPSEHIRIEQDDEASVEGHPRLEMDISLTPDSPNYDRILQKLEEAGVEMAGIEVRDKATKVRTGRIPNGKVTVSEFVPGHQQSAGLYGSVIDRSEY